MAPLALMAPTGNSYGNTTANNNYNIYQLGGDNNYTCLQFGSNNSQRRHWIKNHKKGLMVSAGIIITALIIVLIPLQQFGKIGSRSKPRYYIINTFANKSILTQTSGTNSKSSSYFESTDSVLASSSTQELSLTSTTNALESSSSTKTLSAVPQGTLPIATTTSSSKLTIHTSSPTTRKTTTAISPSLYSSMCDISSCTPGILSTCCGTFQCDYVASTCFDCTYATSGMVCISTKPADIDNACCDPFSCINSICFDPTTS